MDVFLRKVVMWVADPALKPSGAVHLMVRAGLAAAMLLGSKAARADCVPKDNQAAFAVDSNFQGACVVLGIGDYPTATSTGLPNDSISSLRVGIGVQVYACRDENFAGSCVAIRGLHPTLANTGMDNDQITSIKVQSVGAALPCEPGPLQVALYADANYAGSCRRLPVGDYATATSTGLPNDSVSSIRVGPGAQVRVCSDEYFAGRCVLVVANTPYLGNLPIGNDQLTSAKVRPLGASDSPQDFDPRCSDRTATGKFNCTIHQPIVSRAESVYQNVVFAPGDKVFVNGDGCAQIGGTGDTWKRYVNPGGDGADHLYHGLVRVPTGSLAGTDVGNTMTRIEHVVGRPITVTGEGVPASQLVLHLGYEDDDYTNNGYGQHDNGTEDQCKGDGGNDGGPAHVTITICRHTTEPCTSMPSRFPFNVVSDQFDPNGFLFNPHWAWQERRENRGHSPDTTVCHYLVKSSPSNLGLWASPNIPDCTDQSGPDLFDSPGSVNNAWCTAGAVVHGGFSGHINWFPITVEGRVDRVSHDIDDDWDFGLTYDDAKGELYYNQVAGERPFLHTEFDSDETVDAFASKAWGELHQAVNDRESASGQLHNCQARRPSVDCSGLQAASNAAWAHADDLFVGDAIVTGQFGIDGEHGEKSELHPVYAIAINRKNYQHDPGDDVWLMFVRNRGDEGFCSSQIWAGGFDDYTFRLPWREGMTDVEVNWDATQFEGSQGTSDKPEVRVVPPLFVRGTTGTVGVAVRSQPGLGEQAGVYVTFHLGDPTVLPVSDTSASIPFIDGALHLIWSGQGSGRTGGLPTSHRTTGPASNAQTETSPDGEDLLSRAVEHLRPRESEAFKKPGGVQTSAPVMHLMTRGTVTKANGTGVAAPFSRTSRGVRPAVGPVGAAKIKLARDAARLRVLCVATHDRPFGVSAPVCKPVRALDHR